MGISCCRADKVRGMEAAALEQNRCIQISAGMHFLHYSHRTAKSHNRWKRSVMDGPLERLLIGGDAVHQKPQPGIITRSIGQHVCEFAQALEL